ncbi:sensor histidine kinase [Microvirga sp. Mcv34]|uniref:sensor histidine kinase n=1 Tax=Microvirga sp. Mcv34 TaxID=2926016 RepID=UPI0021CA25A1|nr:ATP-binding protein [Microvirga sp. Mcv34]
MRDFAEGFVERTELVAPVWIPEEIDELPPDMQRAVLRVVQEALTNVHRHAGASHVSVNTRIMSRNLAVSIPDNGHGMATPARPDGAIRFGVGIAAMRARLEKFGGDLRIRPSRSGTGIVTMVPAQVPAGRRSLPDTADAVAGQGGRPGPFLKFKGLPPAVSGFCADGFGSREGQNPNRTTPRDRPGAQGSRWVCLCLMGHSPDHPPS